MPGIASPMHFEPTAGVYPRIDRVRPEGEHTTQSLPGFFIRQRARTEIKACNIRGQKKASRIQLAGSLHIPYGVRPVTLPAIDPCTHFIRLWVVRQTAPSNSKLRSGVIVVEVSPIEVQRQSQMRLARIRIQVESRINGPLRQSQTSGCSISVRVEPVVRLS